MNPVFGSIQEGRSTLEYLRSNAVHLGLACCMAANWRIGCGRDSLGVWRLGSKETVAVLIAVTPTAAPGATAISTVTTLLLPNLWTLGAP